MPAAVKIEIVKPFEHQRLTYSGNVCVLKNPLQISDPAAAFKRNPFSNATLEIDYLASSPGWGGELPEQTISGWQPIKDDADPMVRAVRGEYRLNALGMRDRAGVPLLAGSENTIVGSP